MGRVTYIRIVHLDFLDRITKVTIIRDLYEWMNLHSYVSSRNPVSVVVGFDGKFDF